MNLRTKVVAGAIAAVVGLEMLVVGCTPEVSTPVPSPKPTNSPQSGVAQSGTFRDFWTIGRIGGSTSLEDNITISYVSSSQPYSVNVDFQLSSGREAFYQSLTGSDQELFQKLIDDRFVFDKDIPPTRVTSTYAIGSRYDSNFDAVIVAAVSRNTDFPPSKISLLFIRTGVFMNPDFNQFDIETRLSKGMQELDGYWHNGRINELKVIAPFIIDTQTITNPDYDPTKDNTGSAYAKPKTLTVEKRSNPYIAFIAQGSNLGKPNTENVTLTEVIGVLEFTNNHLNLVAYNPLVPEQVKIQKLNYEETGGFPLLSFNAVSDLGQVKPTRISFKDILKAEKGKPLFSSFDALPFYSGSSSPGGGK